MGYFYYLSAILTKTNGHLEPSENLKLQRKYKVSWNTLSIAKKLKLVTSPKQKEYHIVKEVNRAKAILILKEKISKKRQKNLDSLMATLLIIVSRR